VLDKYTHTTLVMLQSFPVSDVALGKQIMARPQVSECFSKPEAEHTERPSARKHIRMWSGLRNLSSKQWSPSANFLPCWEFH